MLQSQYRTTEQGLHREAFLVDSSRFPYMFQSQHQTTEQGLYQEAFLAVSCRFLTFSSHNIEQLNKVCIGDLLGGFLLVSVHLPGTMSNN